MKATDELREVMAERAMKTRQGVSESAALDRAAWDLYRAHWNVTHADPDRWSTLESQNERDRWRRTAEAARKLYASKEQA